MKMFALAGASALLVAIATPAAAITTFASFTPTGSLPNVTFIGSGNGAGTLSSTQAPVTFRLLSADGVSFNDFAADLNLTANTTGAQSFGGFFILPVSTGTISFTSATDVTYNGQTGNNLLTVAFSGSAVTALDGGSVADYKNSTPPYTVTFTSDFLDFSSSTSRDLALGINGINPVISTSNIFNDFAFFQGTVGGQFGADVVSGLPQTAVPEPATWAMMIIGFGAVGGSLRRRKTVRTVTA